MVTYFALFILAWFSLFLTPLGAVGAMIIVWLFAVYHDTLIDDNCELVISSTLSRAQADSAN